jgi:hypothetical protein
MMAEGSTQWQRGENHGEKEKKLERIMEEGRKQWQKGEINNIRRESPGPRRKKVMARERERMITPKRE